MLEKSTLTPRQLQILTETQEYQEAHSYGPRQADLAKALGVTQPSIAQCLKALEASGWVERQSRPFRGVRLTSKALSALGYGEDAVNNRTVPLLSSDYPPLRSLVVVDPKIGLKGILSHYVDSEHNTPILALGVTELGSVVGIALSKTGELQYYGCGAYGCDSLPNRSCHDVMQAQLDKMAADGHIPIGTKVSYENEANRPKKR